MSKEVKRYSPLLGLARNAKLRRMEMQCDPQWVLDLFAERDAAQKALAGLLALDEEDHQRYPGDEDVCAEVRDARAALQGEQP